MAQVGAGGGRGAKVSVPVAIIGFMGSGKSSASRMLATELNLERVDSDQLIEEREGLSITEIFDKRGEAYFREVEEKVVCGLLEGPPRIVSLGGGSVLSSAAQEKLKGCVTVWLDTPNRVAWRRVKSSNRPLARDRERFRQLQIDRTPLYEDLADVILPSSDQTVVRATSGVVASVAAGSVRRGLTVVWAVTEKSGYPVFHGTGLIDQLEKFWQWSECFVITDSTVAGHYLDRIKEQLGEAVKGIYVLDRGEEQKTLTNCEAALRAMAQAGVSRSGTVVAVGGGVVGDLAGFCAAIYQRGIEVVQIPTTLVAQVDSSFGGKTGVDLPEAKNYVGSFHQPTAVFVDPDCLGTLPKEEMAAGYAEVVKTALIAGGSLWERVVAGAPVQDLILNCFRSKLDVVAMDELDTGVRAALNLGHTVGHAIEAATGYSRYRHGEAVALGLLAAIEISEQQLGLDGSVGAKVRTTFSEWGLPLVLEGTDVTEVISKITLDKKREGSEVKWVLLQEPGKFKTGEVVGPELVKKAVEGLT